MNISWYGETCFRINSSQNKNHFVNMLIDPFEKESGLRVPKIEADILLVTEKDKKALSGNFFLIKDPGEYDIKEVYIEGISGFENGGKKIESYEEDEDEDNDDENIEDKKENNEKDDESKKACEKTVIYILETEELKICHLGKLRQKELTSEQVEKIGKIDILMIPIGGGETLNAKEAIKIMSQIEPKIIIPMYYKIPGLKNKLDGLDEFLKSIGVKSIEPLAKLSIKKKDIAAEQAKVIVLKP
ncbi:MAG: MBL fold metallo-hydrolase [Patescibacteria group bacterium]|nr:MBL fold metallo-hydrolase [Patescibacteria group bacterium]